MKLTVINVMQQVGAAFGASFAPYVAELCPYLLKVFYADRTVDRSLTCAVTFLLLKRSFLHWLTANVCA